MVVIFVGKYTTVYWWSIDPKEKYLASLLLLILNQASDVKVVLLVA